MIVVLGGCLRNFVWWPGDAEFCSLSLDSSSSCRKASGFDCFVLTLDTDAGLTGDSASGTIFRFFLGRVDDTSSGEVSREVSDSILWMRSSFFRFVPAATGFGFDDREAVERVIVAEDPADALEEVDARLWTAVGRVHEQVCAK